MLRIGQIIGNFTRLRIRVAVWSVCLAFAVLLGGCASTMTQIEMNAKRGTGTRQLIAGSSADIMDYAANEWGALPGYTVTRNVNAVFAMKSGGYALNWALFTYLGTSDQSTDTELVLASSSSMIGGDYLRKVEAETLKNIANAVELKTMRSKAGAAGSGQGGPPVATGGGASNHAATSVGVAGKPDPKPVQVETNVPQPQPRSVAAPAKKLGILVVMNLSAPSKAISMDDAVALTDVIRSRLTQKIGDSIKVLSKEKVFEILQHSEKTAAQCTNECIVETARMIGADFVVSGAVTKMNGKLLVVLEAKRSRDGASVAAVDLEVAQPSELRSGIGAVIQELANTLVERAESK